ncbi:thiol-disulfide oxidoreductase DCC family protein [Microbacterium rhizomatis]
MSLTLVFDGDCAFCSRAVTWLGGHVSFTAQPWQFADIEELGLSLQQVESSVWLLENGRSPVGGADAFALLFSRARMRRWRIVGALMRWRGIRHAARLSYRWIARHRNQMPGGTPACAVVS